MLALTSKAIMAASADNRVASVTILKRSEQPQNAIMWPIFDRGFALFQYDILLFEKTLATKDIMAVSTDNMAVSVTFLRAQNSLKRQKFVQNCKGGSNDWQFIEWFEFF